MELDKAHKVVVLFLYSGDAPGYKKCTLPLPNGLTFSTGRAAAARLLGLPSKSGGPVDSLDDRPPFYWDRWDVPTYSMHVRYAPALDRITEVTIMRPDRVPDKR